MYIYKDIVVGRLYVDYIHTTSLRVVSIYISRSDYTYTSSHIYLMHPPLKSSASN